MASIELSVLFVNLLFLVIYNVFFIFILLNSKNNCIICI